VITLVPVAAILVASIRLHFLDVLLNMQYRGKTEIPCRASFSKGQEMGWFQHGSTIIVFAPKGFVLCKSVETGAIIRMGRPLMRLPS
jgi:phosphatidylserine decarboxylase